MRLEHQFAVDEDDGLSKPVVVQLTGLFKEFEILHMTELNLAANKMIGKIRENSIRFDDNDYSVTLKPMEILTFKLDIRRK